MSDPISEEEWRGIGDMLTKIVPDTHAFALVLVSKALGSTKIVSSLPLETTRDLLSQMGRTTPTNWESFAVRKPS
jgi:hypothetical protein